MKKEVMFFLSGRGTLITGHEQFVVEPGRCVCNPPVDLHRIVNDGEEVQRLIWAHSPQLPSRRK